MLPAGPGGAACGFVLSSSFQEIMRAFADSFSASSISPLRWKKIDRLVCLTGTPASNGLLDLWAPQYLVDKGTALGRTLTGFRERWFTSDYMGWKWEPRDNAEDEIHAAMAPTCLSMAAADYLDMPERINVNVEHIIQM